MYAYDPFGNRMAAMSMVPLTRMACAAAVETALTVAKAAAVTIRIVLMPDLLELSHPPNAYQGIVADFQERRKDCLWRFLARNVSCCIAAFDGADY